MTATDDVRARLVRAVRQLGAVADRVVLAGGCAPAAWKLSAVAGDVRPTEDIDLIVETSSLKEYYEIARAAGLSPHEDVANPGPLCRHVVAGMLIDLMPTDPRVLGFANTWYPLAFATAERRELAPGATIRVITPILFIATKLEALASRGGGDYQASQDFEDIVTAFVGVPGLAWTLRTGRDDVHEYIRARFRGLLDDRKFVGAWADCAGGDSSQQAVATAMLGEIRAAVAPTRGPCRVQVRIQGGDLEFSVPRQSLRWSEGADLDGARLQAEADRIVRDDASAVSRMLRCWAAEPFDEQRLQYVAVAVVACECEECVGVPDGTPCWGCDHCLDEARETCPRCGWLASAFPERSDDVFRVRARIGYLLTDSLRCRVHDHDACPRRWEFSTPVTDGKQMHVAACDCECHR